MRCLSRASQRACVFESTRSTWHISAQSRTFAAAGPAGTWQDCVGHLSNRDVEWQVSGWWPDYPQQLFRGVCEVGKDLKRVWPAERGGGLTFYYECAAHEMDRCLPFQTQQSNGGGVD